MPAPDLPNYTRGRMWLSSSSEMTSFTLRTIVFSIRFNVLRERTVSKIGVCEITSKDFPSLKCRFTNSRSSGVNASNAASRMESQLRINCNSLCQFSIFLSCDSAQWSPDHPERNYLLLWSDASIPVPVRSERTVVSATKVHQMSCFSSFVNWFVYF